MGSSHSRPIPKPKDYWDKDLLEGIVYDDSAKALNAIKKGANIHLLRGNWCTPIHKAAECGHHEIVKILLDAGADKDDVCHVTGKTPLHGAIQWAIQLYAEYSQQVKTVGVLLNAQANPNLQDKNGDTPLHKAITAAVLSQSGSWLPFDIKPFDMVIKLLLASGARIDIRNNNGQTPLCLARVVDAHEGSKLADFLSKYQIHKLQKQSVDKEKIIEPSKPPSEEIAKLCKQLTTQLYLLPKVKNGSFFAGQYPRPMRPIAKGINTLQKTGQYAPLKEALATVAKENGLPADMKRCYKQLNKLHI